MANRDRATQKRYIKHRKQRPYSDTCTFCAITTGHEEILRETKRFKILINLFPYSDWDEQDVEHHIMIVPKKHVGGISEFSSSESIEFMGLLGSYERQGYNIWMRAPATITKSVVHQHTHLIKPGNKTQSFLMFTKRPYLRIIR